MDDANIRHLPVFRGPRVVSMRSICDFMRVDMERMGQELRFLNEYLHALPPDAAADKK